MKKLTSFVLSSLLVSYSLTGCSSQSNLPVEEQVQNQEVSVLSTSKVSEIDRTFNYLDSNKDSKVSYDEFKKIVDLLAPSSSDKTKLYNKFNSSFTLADANKDKMLNKEEFGNFSDELQKLSGKSSIGKNSFTSSSNVDPKYIKKTFDMIRGADDNITERTFIKFLTSPPDITAGDASKVFIQLDKNKDATLDLKEFTKLFDKISGSAVDKNGIIDTVKRIAPIIPLLLIAPILWVIDKLGGFDNIK